MIEGLYPNAPKLEMFARGEGVVRDGWTYWGNEAPSDD
jgi:N6-adenosine-specific RNA methylase IME4